MKKSYRILQLQFYKGTHPSIHHQHTTSIHMHPENSPSRIQFYMQKTKSPLSTTTTTTTDRGQGDLHYRKEILRSRRQGNLLEIHPCVLQDLPKTFQAFQPQDLPKAFQTFQSFQIFQTFQSFMTFQPFQAFLQVPVPPGFPSHYSILPIRMHILHILQILQFDWFPQKTPPSTSWTIQTTNILQTLHSSKKGRCCDIGQNTHR